MRVPPFLLWPPKQVSLFRLSCLLCCNVPMLGGMKGSGLEKVWYSRTVSTVPSLYIQSNLHSNLQQESTHTSAGAVSPPDTAGLLKEAVEHKTDIHTYIHTYITYIYTYGIPLLRCRRGCVCVCKYVRRQNLHIAHPPSLNSSSINPPPSIPSNPSPPSIPPQAQPLPPIPIPSPHPCAHSATA